MSRLLRVLILAGLLAVNVGFAQDATKVEPKHYKLAFENERVQVVYIHYGPATNRCCMTTLKA